MKKLAIVAAALLAIAAIGVYWAYNSLDVIVKAKPAIGYQRLDSATDVAKISVIGIGMRSHAGVAAQAFRALAERAVNIRAITTSEIKFSLLIDAAFTELAVRTLHSLYGLDRPAP